MLEISGSGLPEENEAARLFAEHARLLWPDLEDSKTDSLKIYVGRKVFGQPVQDLDLVITAHFARPRPFRASGPVRIIRSRQSQNTPGDDVETYTPQTCMVAGIAVVIEVKSHDARNVSFDGAHAIVRYRDGSKDATQQSFDQRTSIRGVARSIGIQDIWWTNVLYFPNLTAEKLPRCVHNIVTGCHAGENLMQRLLSTIAGDTGGFRDPGRFMLRPGKDASMSRLLAGSLFPVLQPSSLDRKRMDRIARKALPDQWFEELGEKQIVLRGHGGTGKTVILLQMAYKAYTDEQHRSLILTYNLALRSDIERMMALLQVRTGTDQGGIKVASVMSLIRTVIIGCGIITAELFNIDRYNTYCGELAGYLSSGAITRQDILHYLTEESDFFDFDHVFIDEGQDWPETEIAIVRHIFPPKDTVISDGLQQLVRQDTRADWTKDIPRDELRIRRLRRGFRMKATLARFANLAAQELGLENWEVEPNDEASGGRVVIVCGDYFARPDIHAGFQKSAEEEGNKPIDLLVCVPPSQVEERGEKISSLAGRTLAKQGYTVWDGTSRETRDTFPVSVDQTRIVQYRSCRGLEGWTVIATGFDSFWRSEYRNALNHPPSSKDLFFSPEEHARATAGGWMMIPFTRAIDTLVINIGDEQSEMGRMLRRVHNAMPDSVEWITL